MQIKEILEKREQEELKDMEKAPTENLRNWHEGRASAFRHAKNLCSIREV